MSLIAILIASLLGSPHCAAMCGGFVTFYAGRSSSPGRSHIMYHGGRLLSYMSVGALAGFLGQSIDDLSAIVGLQRVSAMLIGIALVVWGIRGFLGKSRLQESISAQGNSLSDRVFFKRIISLYQRVLSAENDTNWARKAFLIGVLSTLLPCGWLYAFAAVATTSASPLMGAGVMLVFWLGTLPALLAVGSISQLLGPRLHAIRPRLTSLLFLLAGIFSILGHFELLPLLPHQHQH